MQNQHNLEYSGLKELLITEKYRINYNNFIVERCVKKMASPNGCVDFGAGIGTLSRILEKKLNLSVVCVEIDEENIRYLNNRALKNSRSINDIEEDVDLVFSSNVLEHIEDDVDSLCSIRRKLNSHGVLYLYLPASMLIWSKVDDIVGHYRRYSRSEIKQKLMSSGFEVESIYYADSIGFLAIFLIKLFRCNTDKVVESPKTLKIYDTFIFPLSKFLDAIGLKYLFGKNLIVFAKKID